MKTITLKIECGETTCASKSGKFCQFLGSKKFGSIAVCMLFPTKNPTPNNDGLTVLEENENGWIARCDQCLAATND